LGKFLPLHRKEKEYSDISSLLARIFSNCQIPIAINKILSS